MDTVLFMYVGRTRTPIGSWAINTPADILATYVQALTLAAVANANASGARVPAFDLVIGA